MHFTQRLAHRYPPPEALSVLCREARNEPKPATLANQTCNLCELCGSACDKKVLPDTNILK